MQANQGTSANFDVGRLVRGWPAVVLLLITIAAPLWHVHIINRRYMPSSREDMALVWTGVRATLRGESPYTAHVTQEIQINYYGRSLGPADHAKKMAYAYPPYTALVLAPIAKLSWPTLRLGFLFSVPLLMFATVPLWMSALNISWDRKTTLLTCTAFAASWPVIWALRLQQPTLLICFFVAAGCFLIRKNKDVAAGFLLALTTIKPQVVAPLLIWLIVWAVYQGRIRFAASLLGFISVLVLWSNFAIPGWPVQWRSALVDYAKYTNVKPVLESVFGHWLGLLLMALVAISTAWMLWERRKCSVASSEFGAAIAIVLAATIVLIPTEPPMIYNDVFLLPAFLLLIQATPPRYYAGLARRVALGLLIWTYLAPVVAVLGETAIPASDAWAILPLQITFLPVSLLLALGFNYLRIPNFSRHVTNEVTAALQ